MKKIPKNKIDCLSLYQQKKQKSMNSIQSTIIDLFYLNYSVDQIAEYLKNNNSIEKNSNLEKIIEKTLKDFEEEMEADAYLSSIECYYDNFCEY